MPTQLNLENEERELLSRILSDYLGNLRMEIGATDSRNMRAEMHRNEETIMSIVERLTSGSSAKTVSG
jgi:hypothetical protein